METNTAAKKYLYGVSALLFYEVPQICGTVFPPDFHAPQEFLIFNEKGKSLYAPKGFRLHSCSHEAAKNWVVDGICLPEFAYIQVCKNLNKWEAVLLGYQLCARRSGKKQSPLCSVRTLQKCIDELGNYPGVVMARWAVKYIQENSNSPEESMVCMRLSLPVCHGGLGFRNLRLNYPVICKKSQHRYIIDFCDPIKKVAIEFDSESWHGSQKAHTKDTLRENDLKDEGYTVISLVHEQVTDVGRVEVMARLIAAALKKTVRIRAMKFFHAYMVLQDLLKQDYRKHRDFYHLVRKNEAPLNLAYAKKYYGKYLEKRKQRKDHLKVDVFITCKHGKACYAGFS